MQKVPRKFKQTGFNSTLNGSCVVTNKDSPLACKDGSTCTNSKMWKMEVTWLSH